MKRKLLIITVAIVMGLSAAVVVYIYGFMRTPTGEVTAIIIDKQLFTTTKTLHARQNAFTIQVTYYQFNMDNSDIIEVSINTYNSYNVGDEFTYNPYSVEDKSYSSAKRITR